MNPLRRPEGRFAFEALAIVAAAAVPGYLHVTWKHVLALVIAVLLGSVLLEVLIALRGRRKRKRQQPMPALAVEPQVVEAAQPELPAPPLKVIEPAPRAEPPAEQPPVQQPQAPPAAPQVPLPPRPVQPPADTDIDRVIATVFSDKPVADAPVPPRPRAPAAPPPALVPSSGPWKLAQLERALRAQPNPDPELLYMIGYLRDYAEADGTLPAEFDELVRDAFGPVLGISR
ncbi:MAG TPA: hypothetical protein VGH52_04540 [Gaiellaceae bacterium]|jgi:hypothetical protein